MTRGKSILGALIVCAACLCAFGAANASAANIQLHECINISNGSGTHATKYEEGCKNAIPGGTWETVKQIKRSKLISTRTSRATLSAVLSGVEVEIQCEGEEGEGEAENTETGVSGESFGESFSECVLTKPAGKGCTVPATIKTKALTVSTKEMNVNYVPKEGTTFVTIPIEGATCPAALKGNKEVTGSASAVVSAAEPTSAEFTTTSGSALKFGGQTATFIFKAHSKTKEGTTVALETP
jgi:hypothetical protein